MAKRWTYTKPMLNFLTKHYPNCFVDELTKRFNKRFNLNKTEVQIKACLFNHNIKAGVRRSRPVRLYTDKHLTWLKQWYPKLKLPELTEAFNKKFKGMNVSANSIRGCLKNNKITCGRTGHFVKGGASWNKGMKGLDTGGSAGWFKPGSIPVNHRPLGTERINICGYVEVKVAEPNKWDLKHRVVWREHHGEITSDDFIQFRDNNRLNCSIDNLFLSNKFINGLMNSTGLNQLTGELKDTAQTFAKLKIKTKELQ
ncbi:HNH endonuclease signature motif containing protein [Glaciecola sp. 2405UD65-10]|uniref:HNH endonuclease signature motif containing protein n=1 Tax=Glaciecola sp. 2405UD65-10 TaxID=3397244 RepID=UPI003B5ABEE0